jgi:tetratricopeptide (TPR) repeat protein
VGLLVFALYAWLVPPGPYWLDSQELGAAGVRLGVAHPTGFPLFCVLARALAYVPLGELAFRVHLLSAALAAVAVGCTTRLVMEALASKEGPDTGAALVAGLGAGLLLAVSTTFLRQATVTEVYAPTAALMGLALVLAQRVARGGSSRVGLSLALVFGLGLLGVHASFGLLFAVPLALLVGWRLRHGARWALYAPLLVLLGSLGTLVYLPLRSASGHIAAVDWSQPRTATALWAHLGAERIQAAYETTMLSRTPEVVWQNLRFFAAQVEAHLGTVALVLASVGIVLLLGTRGRRTLALWLFCVAALDFAYGAWVNPMGLRDLQNGVPLSLAVAALAGVGAQAVTRRLGRAAPFGTAVVLVLAIFPAALGNVGEMAASRRDAPRAWAEAALAQCPPRAVALVTSDSTAAGLLWLTAVEGSRPDVAVLVRQHLWNLRRNRAVLGPVGLGSVPALDLPGSLSRQGRPVAWEPSSIDDPGAPLAVDVPLGRVATTPGEPLSSATVAQAVPRLERIFGDEVPADRNGRRMYAVALSSLGRGAVEAGQHDVAVTLYSAAHTIDPTFVPAYMNLGALFAAAGNPGRAATLTEEGLVVDPNHVGSRINAARYRLSLGDDALSRRHAERATRLEPRRADAWALLGILDARQGHYARARRHLQHALDLDPENHDARVNLAKLPTSR